MDIKELTKKNIYIQNYITKFKYKKNNDIIREKVEECFNIDSILNFQEFKDLVMSWKLEPDFMNSVNEYKCVGSESLFYGQLKALCDYSGVSYKNSSLLIPKAEHGPDFWERERGLVNGECDFNYLFQGDYKVEAIHRMNPYTPVYVIGPYVYYAQDYYTEEKFSELKRKLGKTLLVFPFHSYETRTLTYNSEQLVDDIMDNIAKDFDTVMVSIYWNDVDSELCNLFKKRGAILVSNGFRCDDNFIRRLKAIIQLSDATIGNDLGSHIGYSVCLGKPHIFLNNHKCKVVSEDEEMKLTNLDDNKKNKNFEIACDEFSLNKYYNHSNADNSQFYNKFWGGKKYIKSKEQIKAIFDISKNILDNSMGFRQNFDKSVVNILRHYKENNDLLHYNILRDALGNIE